MCGVLWEFWNYWALAKWRYVGVPVFPSVRLFEMPLAGYLGFPPFALEVFALYHLVRPLVGLSDPGRGNPATDPIPTEVTRGGRQDRGEEDREALRDEEGGEQTVQGGSAPRRQGCEDREGCDEACRQGPRRPKAATAAAPPKRAAATARPASAAAGPSLGEHAERLRDEIQRSKLSHPDPWRYAAKARGWGERAQVLVELIAVRGDTASARGSLEALAAELAAGPRLPGGPPPLLSEPRARRPSRAEPRLGAAGASLSPT